MFPQNILIFNERKSISLRLNFRNHPTAPLVTCYLECYDSNILDLSINAANVIMSDLIDLDILSREFYVVISSSFNCREALAIWPRPVKGKILFIKFKNGTVSRLWNKIHSFISPPPWCNNIFILDKINLLFYYSWKFCSVILSIMLIYVWMSDI